MHSLIDLYGTDVEIYVNMQKAEDAEVLLIIAEYFDEQIVPQLLCPLLTPANRMQLLDEFVDKFSPQFQSRNLAFFIPLIEYAKSI